MPEILAEALAIPGFWLLVATVLVAGTVRGFSGFGTGLIYLPVAAQVLPPVWAIITIVVFDLFGPAVIARRALRDAHLPDMARLFLGTAIGLPIGIAVLLLLAPEAFSLAISVIALVLVALLISGLRYTGPRSPALVLGTGGLAGLMGGASGVPGPPVIFLYLGSNAPAAVVRAHNLLFLLGYDVLVLVMFAVLGRFEFLPVVLGLLLALPNMAGNLIGNWLFRPGFERVYRAVAYGMIVAAALSGLPIWG